MKFSYLRVSIILLTFLFSTCTKFCWAAEGDNLQDTCPTDTARQNTTFINGFPCKNPNNVTASDFKSSSLNHTGDTDNFYSANMTILTAAEFLGLNFLGLSVARTDMEVDGLIMPHSHPRASEIIFVSSGMVTAGFIDTNNQVFQKSIKEGDVFVFPKGLLHYFLNSGFEVATVFSVLNSQNPGVVSISGAMFGPNEAEGKKAFVQKLFNLSKIDAERIDGVNLFGS